MLRIIKKKINRGEESTKALVLSSCMPKSLCYRLVKKKCHIFFIETVDFMTDDGYNIIKEVRWL